MSMVLLWVKCHKSIYPELFTVYSNTQITLKPYALCEQQSIKKLNNKSQYKVNNNNKILELQK
jgi:hypothetical protein